MIPNDPRLKYVPTTWVGDLKLMCTSFMVIPDNMDNSSTELADEFVKLFEQMIKGLVTSLDNAISSEIVINLWNNFKRFRKTTYAHP